jgi:hypothetical protein
VAPKVPARKAFGLMLEHYSVCFIARLRLAVDNGWKDGILAGSVIPGRPERVKHH